MLPFCRCRLFSGRITKQKPLDADSGYLMSSLQPKTGEIYLYLEVNGTQELLVTKESNRRSTLNPKLGPTP